MNPARWRSRYPGFPTLERVADCGNHAVNVECPHVDVEQCQAMEHVSTGLVHMGFGAYPARKFGHITWDEVTRGIPPSTLNLKALPMTWSIPVMMDFRFAPDAPGWDNGRLQLDKPIRLDAELGADDMRLPSAEYPRTEDCEFLLTTFAPYTWEAGRGYSDVPANVLLTTPSGPERQVLMCGTFPASAFGVKPRGLQVPKWRMPGSLTPPIYGDFKANRLGLIFELPVGGGNVGVGCLFGGLIKSPPSEDELKFRRGLRTGPTMDTIAAGRPHA